MTAAISFLALLAAAGALGHGAWRCGAALGADGALRIVAAAPIAAAAAGLTALVLGRFGLSGSQLAVIGVSVALGALARARLPRPAAAEWSPRRRERLALGAAAGLGLAWTIWAVRFPSLGIDPLSYHLSESVLWTQNGDAGVARQVTYVFPVGNYPLLDELLVSWVLSASHWLGAASLWAPAMMALGATAAATGLRRAGVGLLPAALAVSAIVSIPIWARMLIGPHNDVGALAWLVCAVTLAVAARRQPGLFVPAALAAGLSIGTKATTAPMLLAAAVLLVRPPFPRMRLLLPALGAAGVLGGLWYVRNLLEHGSPLWPFVALPFGDAVPRIYSAAGDNLLSTLDRSFTDGQLGDYFGTVGAAPALLLAAPVAAVCVRTRRVVLAAAVAVLGALIWARAPFTGRPEDPLIDFTLGTTRYLVPAVAAAVLALALATADGSRRTRLAVSAFLAACVAVSAVKALELGFPDLPRIGTLAAGAAGGWVLVRLAPRWAPIVGLLVLAAVCVRVTDQFAARHAQNPDLRTSAAIAYVAGQPGFEASDDPVATAPVTLSALAGDRLRHDLRFLPEDVDCTKVRTLRGWLVLGTPPPTSYIPSNTAVDCLAGVTPVFDDGHHRVYDRRR